MRRLSIALLAAATAAPALADGPYLTLGTESLELFTTEQPTATAPAPDPEKLEPPKEEEGWTFLKGWTGGVEIGINGSEGNSQTFNVHAGANAQRKTDKYDTKASVSYLRASADSEVTKNRFEANVQNDWIFEKDSPWRYFIKGTYEYDDFQDWQHRVSILNGIGYAFIENERTTLIGRAGVGLRRDIGGQDNHITPEGLLGADLSHKLTERQLLTATAEVYPSFRDASEFRAKLKVAWEILVDPETKMSLKIGIEDRYDSNPGGDKKRNDLDYFALLVWSF
jgi:putative salt-induced outer membrane protein YdiY